MIIYANGKYEEYEYNLGTYYKKNKLNHLEERDKYINMLANNPDDDNYMFNLGVYYFEIDKNYDYMKLHLGNAIQKNNKYAMFIQGRYYEFVEKRWDIAIKYYTMAGRNGYVMAIASIGQYYDKNKDYERAKKYYNIAAKKGCNVAINNLAHYYHNVEKNYEEAKKHYLKAIEGDHPATYNNLGNFYKTVEKNYDEAKKCYIKSIEKSSPVGMYLMGLLLYDIEKKYEEGKTYLLMAINYDNAKAMKKLGDIYFKNEDNIPLAKKYYSMAIEKENTDAMVSQGIILVDEKQLEIGKNLLCKAISLNNLSGYIGMVKYHMLNKNYFDALACAEIVNQKNLDVDGVVACCMGYYHYIVTGDYILSKIMLNSAIEKKNISALMILGDQYEKIDKNIERAKELYLKGITDYNRKSCNIYCFEKYMKIGSAFECFELWKTHKHKMKDAKIDKILVNRFQITLNKINLAKKIGSCPICLDEKIEVIPTDCCHDFCVECYFKVLERKKCSVCIADLCM